VDVEVLAADQREGEDAADDRQEAGDQEISLRPTTKAPRSAGP
jgi:hypothetical protein